MKGDVRVFELPGDYAQVIDGVGDSSLVEVGAEPRAGGVKANKVAAGGAPMWLSITFWVPVGYKTSRRATWRTGRRSGDVRAR